MNPVRLYSRAPSWAYSWWIGVVVGSTVAACHQAVPERTPTVIEPRCHEQDPGAATTARAPSFITSSTLWLHAGCQASTTSTSVRRIVLTQADGVVAFVDLVAEQRIDSSRATDSSGPFCRVVVETRVWQEKGGVRLEVSPFATDVTLCDARLTSTDATALLAAGASAMLERVDVGAAAMDGPFELERLLAEPRELTITASPSDVSCGDDDDVTARIDRYAYADRVVVRFPLTDAPRFAWSSALELDFEVHTEGRPGGPTETAR